MHKAYEQKMQQLKAKPAKLKSQRMYVYCKLFIAVRFNEILV
jgi:hypothetical protein